MDEPRLMPLGLAFETNRAELTGWSWLNLLADFTRIIAFLKTRKLYFRLIASDEGVQFALLCRSRTRNI